MFVRIPGVAALLALPAAASAHIIFAEPQAAAGAYHAAFLRVSHGCGAAATVSIRVEIPDAVDSARPQPKPGWTLAIERQPLAHPARSESGAAVTDRISAITWSGRLPADQFDQFGLLLKLPAAPGALYFPTTQRCTTGANAWINRPATPDAWHATAMPAPMLIVTGGDVAAPMSHREHRP